MSLLVSRYVYFKNKTPTTPKEITQHLHLSIYEDAQEVLANLWHREEETDKKENTAGLPLTFKIWKYKTSIYSHL